MTLQQMILSSPASLGGGASQFSVRASQVLPGEGPADTEPMLKVMPTPTDQLPELPLIGVSPNQPFIQPSDWAANYLPSVNYELVLYWALGQEAKHWTAKCTFKISPLRSTVILLI